MQQFLSNFYRTTDDVTIRKKRKWMHRGICCGPYPGHLFFDFKFRVARVEHLLGLLPCYHSFNLTYSMQYNQPWDLGWPRKANIWDVHTKWRLPEKDTFSKTTSDRGGI